jgi:hypothetical protein
MLDLYQYFSNPRTLQNCAILGNLMAYTPVPGECHQRAATLLRSNSNSSTAHRPDEIHEGLDLASSPQRSK